MKQPLKHNRVLVAEDDYLVGMSIAEELTSLGALVIGPVATADEAMAAVMTAEPDLAVLDIKLRDELVFPIADVLTERGIPYVFQTGYDAVPVRYAPVPRWIKPFQPSALCLALGSLASTA